MKKNHVLSISALSFLVILLCGGYWLRTHNTCRAIHYFSGLKTCEMSRCSLYGLFPYVDCLTLSRETLTKEDMRHLRALSGKIRTLVLIDCSTEESFPEFPFLDTLVIDCGGMPFSDTSQNFPIKTEVLQTLLRSGRLRNVSLTSVQTSVFSGMAGHFESMKILDSRMTDADFLQISDISGLKSLELIKLPNISGVALKRVASECSALETLNVREVPFTDADISLFSKSTWLHDLSLCRIPVTRQCLKDLPQGLWHLDISETSISSEEIGDWIQSCKLTHLRSVQIGGLVLPSDIIETCKTKGIQVID